MARLVSVWTDKKLKETVKLLNAYIDTATIPIISEFAYINKIRRQSLYENAKKYKPLDDALDFLRLKKESQLEKGALSGDLNSTMAIFSLKQLGWRDKPIEEEDNSGFEAFKELLTTVMQKD